MPVTGIILSELLTYMTAQFTTLKVMASMDDSFKATDSNDVGREYLEYQIKFFSAIMGVIALISGIAGYSQKTSFGFLGENATFEIRKLLYNTVMRKNIGWFDLKENGVSVLTSAMAQDTSIINGVSTESLGP